MNNLFLQNKYSKWYFSICNKAKTRSSTRKDAKNILGYVEGHHIIPQSIQHNNLIVYLTPREHFICHWLLTKMLIGENKSKMCYAMTTICRKRKHYLTSKQIQICYSFRNLSCTPERAKKISEARKKTVKFTCNFCNKNIDPGNFKQFHGEKCKLNPNIDLNILEKRSKMKKQAVQTSIKNGTFKIPNPMQDSYLTCPHCGKNGKNLPNMKKNHFNRCKFSS